MYQKVAVSFVKKCAKTIYVSTLKIASKVLKKIANFWSYVSNLVDYLLDRRLQYRQTKGLFSSAPLILIQWTLGDLFAGIEWPEHSDGLSSPFRGQVCSMSTIKYS
jgi:hypothetical protein